MEEAFKDSGFAGRLNVASDGEQALSFLYRKSPRPAFVILDLNLPRKDGREVLAEIKMDKDLKKIPVVILSTSTNIEDIKCAYDLHANCYITKPLDLTKLVHLTKSLEDFWLKLAILPA
jgi:DNA-binding response OmpR family regulator